VLIPAANLPHLMLRKDVVDAAAAGRFHIYAIETVDEALELLTGLTAGAPDAEGYLPEGSVNALVAGRLVYLAELRRAFAMKPEPGTGSGHVGNNDEEEEKE
jgi:hypothetical protein